MSQSLQNHFTSGPPPGFPVPQQARHFTNGLPPELPDGYKGRLVVAPIEVDLLYRAAKLQREDPREPKRLRYMNHFLYHITETPLYTRESLLRAEEAARISANYSSVKLSAFGGGVTIQPLPSLLSPDTRKGVTEKRIVDIHGYQSLVQQSEEDPTAYRNPLQLASFRIAHNESARHREVAHFLGLLLDGWIRRWRESHACHELVQLFETIPVNNSINKLVCFGLGSLESFTDRFGRRHWDQYAAAVLMAETIRRRTGSDCQILSQDPAYSPADEIILDAFNIKVVGRHGAEGFADINEQSAVFTMFADTKVHEIIADPGIPKPAILASDCFAGGLRTDPDVLPANIMPAFGPGDNGSPRIDMLAKEYYQHGVVCKTQGPDWSSPGGIDNLKVNYRRSYPDPSKQRAILNYRHQFELARSFDEEDDWKFIPNVLRSERRTGRP